MPRLPTGRFRSQTVHSDVSVLCTAVDPGRSAAGTGYPDSREQAADLLTQLYDFVVFTHNARFQIDVLALKELLYDSQKDESAALKALTEI